MTTLDQAPTELAGTKSRFALRLRIEHALTAGTVVSLLAVWTLLSHYGLVNPLFLPSPEAVWSSFVEVLTKGYQGQQLHQHTPDVPGGTGHNDHHSPLLSQPAN